ncbi:mitochondrial carrier domain-containing protein [Triangularia setosa]|uniref:Mitochondrial thiamine pyrophosphate carrier 1 n=1 Tax=Triangularia setosa TaxID=2587417 RepID=A0AAN7AAQ4_9PEZI|nr:mitochondrial carrier domain-containing protein [Podospora setosa]
MKVSDVVLKLEVEMEESQNQRDKRVEDLWRKLDPAGHGELDYKGLQRGLQRIDHRESTPLLILGLVAYTHWCTAMKNADHMLQEIIKAVDSNGDGKIQYEEFRTFVETAEKQLSLLFKAIDRDQDGRLDKKELQTAFRRAGLSVPSRRLANFFDEIDMNNDGFISFDEWRDFLLFMPTHHHNSPLEAVLSFYSSIVTVNAEGDSLVSDDTLEGLGTTGFLLQALFGSLLRIANPEGTTTKYTQKPSPETTLVSESEVTGLSHSPPHHKPQSRAQLESQLHHQHQQPTVDHEIEQPSDMAFPTAVIGVRYGGDVNSPMIPSTSQRQMPYYETLVDEDTEDISIMAEEVPETVNSKLTDLLPEPGYFLAGAISGGVSRTATAPLDRLKVYLLVSTKNVDNPVLTVAKTGRPLAALRNAGGPIVDAMVTLWKTGGFRTFFAGNGLNVVKIMPESAIRFGSYEASKRFLAAYEGHDDPTQISTVSKFVAGGIGGMTAQFCVYPVDTLKFRLQCETVQGGLQGNALLFKTAKMMWADGGLRAAYRGLGLGLIGMFPYSAIDIGTFEFLKKKYTKTIAKYYGIHEEDAKLGNVATAVLGASSGALGATMVYPLNVLRTRLQTQGTAMHPPTYTGIVDVATKTVKNEGVRGLYKGLTPNILKVAPALSITWVCYENMKKLLKLN